MSGLAGLPGGGSAGGRGTPSRPTGGILGIITNFVQQQRQRKMVDELQRTVAGNQELDIYRKQAAASGDPQKFFESHPEIAQAVMKIGSTHGIQIPLLGGSGGAQTPSKPLPAAPNGGAIPGAAGTTMQPVPEGAVAPTGPVAGTAADKSGSANAGPRIDTNAFLGTRATTDVQDALNDKDFRAQVLAADSPGKVPLMEAKLGRKLTTDEATQIKSLPVQLGGAQIEADRKALDTIVSKAFDRAAKTGTASSLFATVNANYSRMKKAGYTDDEINALLDPALDQMSPVELAKVASMKSTSGLKDAQADFVRQSAQARIDELASRAQDHVQMAAHLAAETKSINELLPGKKNLISAQTSKLIADAGEATGINARNQAEATWYTDRANDIANSDNIRSKSAALTSIRGSFASTNALIASLEGDKQRISSSLNTMTPTGKAAADDAIKRIDALLEPLKTQRNEYQASIDTLTRSLSGGTAGGATAQLPARPSGGAPQAPDASKPPIVGATLVQNQSTKQYGWRYLDGTIHPVQ